jgi:lysozyme
MSIILPPSRPRLTRADAAQICKHYGIDPDKKAALIFIRGYYLSSMGGPNNDFNIYDDAAALIGPAGVYDTFNANTDPAFVIKNGQPLAQLNLGKYTFAQGMHKRSHKALRAFPEGITLPCTRNGKPSTCRFINIHRGGMDPKALDRTHSAGCLTIPAFQYVEFQTRAYMAMDRNRQKLIDCVLVENRRSSLGQRIFDHNGAVIIKPK